MKKFSVGTRQFVQINEICQEENSKIILVEDVIDKRRYSLKKTLLSVDDRDGIQACLAETTILNKIHHENIMNSIAQKKRRSKDQKQVEYLLILEYCSGGNLKQSLLSDVINSKTFENISNKLDFLLKILFQFEQICFAVKYLHERKPPIAHRNINLKNIFVDSNGKIKLGGFSSATFDALVQDKFKSQIEVDEVIGNLEKLTKTKYRAPEIIDFKTFKKISIEVDIQSLGCIFYFLLFQKLPFSKYSKLKIVSGKYKIPENSFFHELFFKNCLSKSNFIQENVLKLLKSMLTPNPFKRIAIQQVLACVKSLLVELHHLKKQIDSTNKNKSNIICAPDSMYTNPPESLTSNRTTHNDLENSYNGKTLHTEINKLNLNLNSSYTHVLPPKTNCSFLILNRIYIAEILREINDTKTFFMSRSFSQNLDIVLDSLQHQDDIALACNHLFSKILTAMKLVIKSGDNKGSLNTQSNFDAPILQFKALSILQKLIQFGPIEMLQEFFRNRSFLQRVQRLLLTDTKSKDSAYVHNLSTANFLQINGASKLLSLYIPYLINRSNIHNEFVMLEGNFSIGIQLEQLIESNKYSDTNSKKQATRLIDFKQKIWLDKVRQKILKRFFGLVCDLIEIGKLYLKILISQNQQKNLFLKHSICSTSNVLFIICDDLRSLFQTSSYFYSILRCCLSDNKQIEELLLLYIQQFNLIKNFFCQVLKSNFFDLKAIGKTNLTRFLFEFEKKTCPKFGSLTVAIESSIFPLPSNDYNIGIKNVALCRLFKRFAIEHFRAANSTKQFFNSSEISKTQNDEIESNTNNSKMIQPRRFNSMQVFSRRNLVSPTYSNAMRPYSRTLDTYTSKASVSSSYRCKDNSSSTKRASNGELSPDFDVSKTQFNVNENKTTDSVSRHNILEKDAFSNFARRVSSPNLKQNIGSSKATKKVSATSEKYLVQDIDSNKIHSKINNVYNDTQNPYFVDICKDVDLICQQEIDEDEVIYEDLELIERIGIGGFAEVFKGRQLGADVAIKKLIDERQTPESLDEFRSEIKIMRRIQHHNIMMFMGACTVEPNICMVTELLEMSLFDLLHNTTIRLSPRINMKIALGTAKGLEFLHGCDPPILHRDLKSANILLDKYFEPKLADFGLSREKVLNTMTAQTGTFQWMSPEVISGKRYTEKADVFSYGIILWELCVRKIPYEGKTGLQVSVDVVNEKIRPEIIPELCPLEQAKLMQVCQQEDHQARPSFTQIVKILRKMA